jgi:hypothetical protein
MWDLAIITKTQEELQDVLNRSVDTGINIDKSQVMRVRRRN